MAQKYSVTFFECSAKTGENVAEMFKRIGGEIIEKFKNTKPDEQKSMQTPTKSLESLESSSKRECCKSQ